MKIKRNGKWEYVDEYLFEIGFFKDKRDYINFHNSIEKDMKEALKGLRREKISISNENKKANSSQQ